MCVFVFCLRASNNLVDERAGFSSDMKYKEEVGEVSLISWTTLSQGSFSLFSGDVLSFSEIISSIDMKLLT